MGKTTGDHDTVSGEGMTTTERLGLQHGRGSDPATVERNLNGHSHGTEEQSAVPYLREPRGGEQRLSADVRGITMTERIWEGRGVTPHIERDQMYGQLAPRPTCPKCGGPMALRMGRKGPFFDCLCPRTS